MKTVTSIRCGVPALSVLLLFMLFRDGNAHTHTRQPKARNWLAADPALGRDRNYCPHCQSAGGVGAVSGGNRVWPDGVNGVCGDEWGKAQEHLIGGRWYERVRRVFGSTVGGVYTQGQVFELVVEHSAYHKGAAMYQICVISPATDTAEQAQLTESCFENGIVVRQAANGTQPDSDWFYFPRSAAEGSSFIISTWMRLPDNLVCDGVTSRCVMRMHYLTGNTCTRSGTPLEYAMPGLSTCGTEGAGYPEEFWNCIDIRILPSSAPVPSPSPPPPPPPPPPPSPTHTPCTTNTTFRCLCLNKDDGYYPNPLDNSAQTYIGCVGGSTAIYWCPAGQVFDTSIGACSVNTDPDAPGLRGWQCVSGIPFPVKVNSGGDVQCWSEDMQDCSSSCPASDGTTTIFQPPSTGAITCGHHLMEMKGIWGYNTTDHWCETGCAALGCTKGPNAWKCIPGRPFIVREASDGNAQCLATDTQTCHSCPAPVTEPTIFTPVDIAPINPNRCTLDNYTSDHTSWCSKSCNALGCKNWSNPKCGVLGSCSGQHGSAFVGDPRDCTKYYKCVPGGGTVPMACPSGMIYIGNGVCAEPPAGFQCDCPYEQY